MGSRFEAAETALIFETRKGMGYHAFTFREAVYEPRNATSFKRSLAASWALESHRGDGKRPERVDHAGPV